MRFLVVTVLALVYAFQAVLGHAGLHLLTEHEHAMGVVEIGEAEPRIVSCFHAPDDQTPCEHEHHCSHHHSDEQPEHDHHRHQEHSEDDCQICHHLAHTAVPFTPVEFFATTEFVLSFDTPQERYYHAVVVALPLTRGPPVCFA